MADNHTTAWRSYNMSRIKGKNTKPEMLVRRYLYALGFRYRLHLKKMPGSPDIVLRKYNTAIFIHGCFWHGHNNCKYYRPPQTRPEFWLPKIARNQARDEAAKDKLVAAGWKVMVIWECGLKPGNFEKTMLQLVKLLQQDYLPAVSSKATAGHIKE